jgi:arginase
MTREVRAVKKTVRIIGVPMDLGQSRRGVDMGPSALRYSELGDAIRELGYRVEDRGNVVTPLRDTLPSEDSGDLLRAVVSTSAAVYEVGRTAIEEGRLPLFLGGDHSIAVGTIGGVTHASPCGVLWIDAHGDMNTFETSPSGNLHGMPLAALLGRGAPELVDVGRPGPKLEPADVIVIGARALDRDERAFVKEAGIRVYTMREIDERGVAVVAHEALKTLERLPRLHVSLDMDAVDPSEAPGVGTPVHGGLTFREAHLLMEIIADDGRTGSIDVVEVNPILDQRNATGHMGVALVASLLGKSIL